MLRNSIHMQLRVIFEKKVALIIFFILCALMLTNYFTNVFTYKGTDIVDMYHPMKILTLSNYSEYSFYLMQYYPLLVVIPAGFSLFADKQLNQFIFIQSRVGARQYYLGKLIVVFIVTFFIFTTPFLIEILLNIMAFPITAIGDPSNLGVYHPSYIGLVNMYLLSDFYIHAPFLYAISFTLIFGIFSSILAVFTVAVSTFPIKFKVLLFLPVYVLLYLLGALYQLIPTLNIDTNYFFYLRFYRSFYNPTGSLIALISFSILLFIGSVLTVIFQMRKDAI